MSFRPVGLALFLCAALLSLPGRSAAQDIGRIVAIGQLAQTAPLEALQATDIALRDPDVLGSPPNLHLLVELLSLRAELLEQVGRTMAAGDAWASVARTQTFSRESLQLDPVPAFERAAALYEQDGALGHARRALEGAIAAETETGRDGAVLEGLYQTLAGLAQRDADPEAADMAQAAVEALQAPALESNVPPRSEGFRVVDVYYATDRARSGSPEPAKFYGSERNSHLELGTVSVTIPETHVPGTVERPSVWRLDFSASPSRHVLLKSVQPVDPDSFFGQLRGEFSQNPSRDMFVYIHGFNHSFEYAAQRAAQITFDLGNSAVPVMFSWPSRNKTAAYFADAAVVRLSGRRLAVFLEDLVTRSGAQSIHILAHSMGSRALTDALEIMAMKRGTTPQDPPIFGQLMFAAPDVDSELFTAMANVFQPLAKRMTLYASSTDWALVSSHRLHGASARAGLGGDMLIRAQNFDSVDMTEMGEDMLAHNYFSNDSSAMADMATLFWHDAAPDQRCGLQPRGAGRAVVWKYRTGQCPSNDLISVLANLQQNNVERPEDIRKLVVDLIPDQSRLETVLALIERIMANAP